MITIIIPTTTHRDHLINRSIKYYNSFKANIIIVDGGTIKKNIECTEGNISYFYLPNKSVMERLKFALKNTTNEFIILAQDDDFINQKFIKKNLAFLKKRKDYIWAGGSQLFFHEYFGFFFIQSSKNDFNKKFHCSSNKKTRLLFFAERQPQLFASMFRKSFLSKVINDYTKINLRIIYKKKAVEPFFELFFSLMLSFYGKYYHNKSAWQFRDAVPFYPNKKNLIFFQRPAALPYNLINKSLARKNLKKHILKNINSNFHLDKKNVKKLNELINEKIDDLTNRRCLNYKSTYNFFQFKDGIKNKLYPFFYLLKKINYIFKFLFFFYGSYFTNSGIVKKKYLNKEWYFVKPYIKESLKKINNYKLN